jgi:hypothetical protein
METGNFRNFIISFFTGELGEYAIVGGIDEAAAMLLDQRVISKYPCSSSITGR